MTSEQPEEFDLSQPGLLQQIQQELREEQEKLEQKLKLQKELKMKREISEIH